MTVYYEATIKSCCRFFGFALLVVASKKDENLNIKDIRHFVARYVVLIQFHLGTIRLFAMINY